MALTPHDKADALDCARVAIDLELRRYRRRMKESVDAAIAREHAAAMNEMRPFNAHHVAMAAVVAAREEMATQRVINA